MLTAIGPLAIATFHLYAGQLSASGLVKSMHSIDIPFHRASSKRRIDDDDRGIQVTSHWEQYI